MAVFNTYSFMITSSLQNVFLEEEEAAANVRAARRAWNFNKLISKKNQARSFSWRNFQILASLKRAKKIVFLLNESWISQFLFFRIFLSLSAKFNDSMVDQSVDDR